jgi:hypothetical protein
MTAIVCDACKKAVPGARKDVNYMVVLDRELCETCGDQLLNVTKVQMKSRKPYTFKDYNDILVKNLNQLTGRYAAPLPFHRPIRRARHRARRHTIAADLPAPAPVNHIARNGYSRVGLYLSEARVRGELCGDPDAPIRLLEVLQQRDERA